jgi:hypothetical protein
LKHILGFGASAERSSANSHHHRSVPLDNFCEGLVVALHPDESH